MAALPKSILITGASSGIGEALAVAYARTGARLALAGRDQERLEAVAKACRAAGATVDSRTVDVTDRAAMASWIAAVDDAEPLDLVIANAGVPSRKTPVDEISDMTRAVFAVNVDGLFNTVHPALERMTARGGGQIALMSSLAGFRGLPGSPAYSASKATVRAYGEALRGWAARHGVQVSVICPGYVRSRMTAANSFRMPLLMDADRAAGIIVRGLARNRGRIAFPWPMYAAVWLMTALPDRLIDRLTRRLPEKR